MTIFLTIRVILFCRYKFSCFPQDKQEREEEQRKTRIQLYVFISRCIAYPFNAKQPMDMTRRQMKVTKQQLETICSRFQVNLDRFPMCQRKKLIQFLLNMEIRNAHKCRIILYVESCRICVICYLPIVHLCYLFYPNKNIT